MPIVNGRHYLCAKHLAETRRRIDTVCERNPDKSVEWWENWFGPEIERQTRLQLEHCYEVE